MYENQLVAFLDILGTKELIKTGKFSDLHIFDFVNPVGLAAKQIPSVRFAAFSDCVIISAPQEEYQSFISALSYCYSQWCADHVWVRGGISLGDVRWIDDKGSDEFFRGVSNFAYARIYGEAIVSAYQTESASGPGCICFIDKKASDYLISCSSQFIFNKHFTDTLVWAREPEAKHYLDIFKNLLDFSVEDTSLQRQLRATARYFEAIVENKIFLPENFGLGPQYIVHNKS